MKAIGIDLGEDSVKVVELHQSKRIVQILSVFEKKLTPLGTAHDKELESIEFIRQLFSRTDASTTTFVMAVRQDKATVRKKMFPFSDRIKIQKSLPFEMEEDIPFDTENCIFDFKTIQYVGNSCETLSVAVPKVHIEKIISLAKDFGINLKVVSLEGFAFANLIEDWWSTPPVAPYSLLSLDEANENKSQAKKPADVFLNIGHKKTLLCARVNGRVVFIRSLMWGADLIIQQIAARNQMPYIEAQRYLQTEATLHLTKNNQKFDASNITLLIEKSLRDLVRDLQMSFLEIESELNATISEVYFTGGFSQLPHLGAYLTQQLEVACNPVNLLANNSLIAEGVDLQNHQAAARFSIAVGVAIEAFKKPKNPALQLLKGEFLSQSGFIKNLWQDWGKVVQTAGAALIILFVWTHLRESFSTQLNEKTTEALETQARSVAKLPRRQANERGVKKYISDRKKQSLEMNALSQFAEMNSALDILRKISEAAPGKEQSKIDVTQLSVVDNQVKISGYANSPREVTLLSTKLSSLSINNKVTEDPTTLGVMPNRVAFSLSFNTERGVTGGVTK